MIDISYGGYSFPQPLPFVGQDETPIFISGRVDHSLMSINLIGQLTGCDLPSLKAQKEQMVLALSSGFQELTIGNTGFNYAKPINIDFQDSDLTRILPYNVSFEVFHQKDFSEFYGISNPVDTWEYQEDEQGRKVSVTHNVSASAKKTSDTDTLTVAKQFVDSRLKGFDNMSLFFTGDTSILVSKDETVNRLTNSYGVTEVYELSESLAGHDKPDSIVRPSCQISYDSNESLSLTVDGTIFGGISGSAETGHFTPQDATEFAKNAVRRSKIDFEDSLYGDIFREPQSFNYDIDTGANAISFSFSFKDPTDFRTGEVLHDFSSSIEASKDQGGVTLSLNGRVYYNGTKDIFLTDTPEQEQRYQKVEAFFSGLDQYPIAQTHFQYFNDFNLNYNSNPLDTTLQNFSIDKKPHSAEINYSHSYSNVPDLFSGLLKNASVSIETQHPIARYGIKPTIDGSFAVQELYDTLETKSVSVNGVLTEGTDVDSVTSFIYNYMSQHSGSSSSISSDTIETGNNNISISRTFVNE
tara:strand:+ start:1248 stop:2822 length:1575 start_codon:yes stop_codon:yes gene_type:complete